jgi:hypothetical protein
VMLNRPLAREFSWHLLPPVALIAPVGNANTVERGYEDTLRKYSF